MSGKIDQQCLAKLAALVGGAFPIRVEVLDLSGRVLGPAQIDHLGNVYYRGNSYSNPSALRHAVVAPNRPTYKHFLYKGKTLYDWGVHR